MNVLPKHKCMHQMHAVPIEARRVSDRLGLEMQMFVGCHENAGIGM